MTVVLRPRSGCPAVTRGILALRAKAAMARPPRPCGRAPREWRCSLDRGPDAGPSRLALRALRGRSDRRPLERFEDDGLVGFDDPAQRSKLVRCRRAEKPMAPAKGCARVDAVKFGGLQQASAFDHRLAMVEPTALLSQPRHRRLGERIESAPKALAAKPRQTVGLPPGDNFAPAVRAALGFHAAHGPRSRARLSESLAWAPQIARRSARSRTPPLFPKDAILPLPDLRQNRQSLPPLPGAQPLDPGQPVGKFPQVQPRVPSRVGRRADAQSLGRNRRCRSNPRYVAGSARRLNTSKQNQAKMLGLAWFYSFQSRPFNALRQEK